jgi:hypothetical protein
MGNRRLLTQGLFGNARSLSGHTDVISYAENIHIPMGTNGVNGVPRKHQFVGEIVGSWSKPSAMLHSFQPE